LFDRDSAFSNSLWSGRQKLNFVIPNPKDRAIAGEASVVVHDDDSMTGVSTWPGERMIKFHVNEKFIQSRKVAVASPNLKKKSGCSVAAGLGFYDSHAGRARRR
jgi:hypothetical protein